jgi:hypothetical protein
MNSLAAAAKYLVAQFVVIGCCGGDERRGIDHCYCVLFASSVSLKWSSCLYLWGCCAVRAALMMEMDLEQFVLIPLWS